MGGKLLAGKRADEGHDGVVAGNDPAVGNGAAGAGQAPAEVVAALCKTIRHYFPSFSEWLGQLSDGRNQDLITYSRQTLVLVAILTMLCKLGRRRQIGLRLRRRVCVENVRQLAGQADLETVPHGDTVEYYFERSAEEGFEQTQAQMIRRAVRMRAWDGMRLLDGWYVAAIDGVHVHTFDYEHCPECLVREHTDAKTGLVRRQWHHYKLQASLVTAQGLCVSVCSEWIRNGDGREKQDCERRAFYRLIEKLRRLYPRMRICVVLDSLYACAPVMEALGQARLEWIIVFKSGSMPEVYEWIMRRKEAVAKDNVLVRRQVEDVAVRKRRTHQQRLERGAPRRERRQKVIERRYSWGVGIKHWDGRTFNVLNCTETEDGRQNCDYVWLLSDGLPLCRETAARIAEEGGRLRWKIENEGNNTQKNGGYELEHCYSRDPVAMKIWVRIIDMAHLIEQLLVHGSLIKTAVYGSVRNIAARLLEQFCSIAVCLPDRLPPMRIRLFWDSG